jgi:hypothetical protein
MKAYMNASWFRIKDMLGKVRARSQDVEPYSPRLARGRPSQQYLPKEFLESELPPNIYAFLFDIFDSCMQSDSDIITALDGIDKSSIVDELLNIIQVNDAYNEIAEREAKSFEVGDFRQVLGWRMWLFILANYKYMASPADQGESASQFEDYMDSHAKMLKSIVTSAHEAGDWDTLLLIAGFCQWSGWLKWRDEIWHTVTDQIGQPAIIDHLEEIESKPRMLIEKLPLHHSKLLLMEAE